MSLWIYCNRSSDHFAHRSDNRASLICRSASLTTNIRTVNLVLRRAAREKVNHETAAERFLRPLRRRSRLQSSLRQNVLHAVVGKARKLAPKWAHHNDNYYFNINLLDAGWGGRIRTSEWRNQNPLPYHLATPQYAVGNTLREPGRRFARRRRKADHNGALSSDQCWRKARQ